MDALDEELVTACLGGDHRAWSRLIARYQRLVYSVAGTICRESHDTEDVFQQVCLDWFQQLGQLRDVQALPAWLITVTRRKAFAVVRSRQAHVDLEVDTVATDTAIAAIEREHALSIALNAVSDRCRRLVQMLYLDPREPSYADIARSLEMPESSVGPTRARCMDKLRKLLESN